LTTYARVRRSEFSLAVRAEPRALPAPRILGGLTAAARTKSAGAEAAAPSQPVSCTEAFVVTLVASQPSTPSQSAYMVSIVAWQPAGQVRQAMPILTQVVVVAPEHPSLSACGWLCQHDNSAAVKSAPDAARVHANPTAVPEAAQFSPFARAQPAATQRRDAVDQTDER
jgi:hypothetical protein